MKKIFTLIGTGDMGDGSINAFKSWPEITLDVIVESKKIIIDTKLDEDPFNDIEHIQENFLLLDDPQQTIKTWNEDQHLSMLIWADEIDEFYIISSPIDQT